MILEQKGQKKMLAYDLHFALLMWHEYGRRDTRILGDFSLRVTNLGR